MSSPSSESRRRFEAARVEALDEAGDPDAYWALVEQLWDADPVEAWAWLEPLAEDPDPRLQQLAVDVLSQLGHEGQPLFMETLALFTRLVSRGPPPELLACIAGACARFHDPRVVVLLAPHAQHPDPAVRQGVLHALRRSSRPEALAALIALSQDPVDELREWATFALGSQKPLVDGPELRAALAARLTDAHGPTRDEAVVGLGLRADPRALGPLKAQLERGFTGEALFEAAEALASPLLIEALRALVDRPEVLISLKPPEREALARAIEACAPRVEA